MNQSVNENKHRPYLTISQIKRICELISFMPQKQNIDIEILKSLELYAFKAEKLIVQPAYKTLANKLGISTESCLASPVNLYEIWLKNPAQLSANEQEAVAEYRYTADLMDADEMYQYEQMIMGRIGTKE
jgi:hypothetical protein